MSNAPTIEKIQDAAKRIEGHAVRTPLINYPLPDSPEGARLFIKPETLQRTGSFKFRGAYTKISRLSPDERAGGVVAFSSGNHAQGVAAAAGLHGIKSTIVMPKDAPAIKIANTRALGAEVVLYDRYSEDREAIGQKISDDTGAILVRPFDDPDIISGQATAALEIVQDIQAMGLGLDIMIVPCGGGGLLAGTALAVSNLSPKTEIWGVEPEGFDDTLQYFKTGERVGNDPAARTICDALSSPLPGELTFSINKDLVAGFASVTDDEAGMAMREAFTKLKLVVEPGGAVALAAVLAGKIDTAGKTVAVICSGGNVDPDLYAGIITGGSSD
ncbi:MAG: threonine/serine dehydratase [Rhodospirillales bacterium]|jgi:threonine dehydratase|nr:threonine/serine dehydratase [Rhodospirillales bacterium]MBT4039099.1 threonine/serine dehydratase [Rhodospirillales bacterium]MBT4625500.1 threonine/serine dehydratase [Rhodospirillales bacterium]MBT5352138.1 threonine/serine dehydratase [Rhodospirillales bacterium]MBT5521907.1 threonine/serine dehydratase [Rhodospirillales bacterium]